MPSSNYSDFASWIGVKHEDNQPEGTITELNGGSANVSQGFGGSNIWLRTIKADKPDTMMNNISIYIGHGDAARTDDLAKGAGGDYRFLDWTRNMTATKFITEFSLWRQSIPQGAPPAGWDGMTGDINAGRGGDNLYLIWKSDIYTGSK
ncbi:hypothetical protein H9Q72_002394 [Fusarium xylarioides]|uniref:Uncharacterized protein n=1 Tax=Fusarium xylarioides TaxID=221167 RepID=A0A9P7I8T5_9HYPO|nr:hypothetical protein H9Q70_002599 [Fusarium xylarioides]KAG5770918.1 hypothetical protein H9Q72_002394 [Fusarium xylarioides]KAG5775821.1 hypothetical protein H9Q73_010512 [Fusarium xylarioides]